MEARRGKPQTKGKRADVGMEAARLKAVTVPGWSSKQKGGDSVWRLPAIESFLESTAPGVAVPAELRHSANL